MDNLDISNPVERSMVIDATMHRSPISGSLELTPLCNMNCDMCYVRLSREELNEKGKLRTAEEWLTLASEMAEQGVLFLLLTGGEPLLYPDFKKLYLALMNMGFILTINTNGTLINEEWADFFGENRPRRINITLYGASTEVYEELCHNSSGYECALHAIQLLHERGVDVKINGSVTTKNENDCIRLQEIADQLRVVSHTDAYMYPAKRERNREFMQDIRFNPEKTASLFMKILKNEKTPEKYRYYLEQMLNQFYTTRPGSEEPGYMKCRAGKSSFIVTWDGLLRPCVMLDVYGVPVFELGFSQAWKELGEIVDNIRVSSKCSACQYRNVCTVCAASALHEAGSTEAVPEYICRYTKEIIRLMEIEWKKLQEKVND